MTLRICKVLSKRLPGEMAKLKRTLLLSTLLILLTTNANAQNIILDLDTDDVSTNTDVVFIEAERRLGLLENSSISIQDDQGGSTTLSRATAQFINPTAFNLNFEHLELNTARLLPSIQSTPSHAFSNGLLTIDGTYSFMEYEVILRAIDYINTNQAPNDATNRIIEFQVFDGPAGLNSNTANVSFNEFRVYNDPPLVYLGGTSEQQRNSTIMIDGQVGGCTSVISGSYSLSLVDSTGISSLCFEVETSAESVSDSTTAIQRINDNLYCATENRFSNTGLSIFQLVLEQSQYCISSAPTGTRTVRVYAEDDGMIVSPGGNTAGSVARSQIAFLFVTFPDLVFTTPPNPPEEEITPLMSMTDTSSTMSPTTLPPTTLPPTTLPPTTLPPTTLPPTALPPTTLPPTALPPTTLTEIMSSSTTATSPSTLTPLTLTSPTDVTITSTCPNQENVPLFSGALLTLFHYNWTEANVGQSQTRPCPQICQELMNVALQGNVIRTCNSITETIAEWSDTDASSCGLTTISLQLCEARQLLRDEADIQDGVQDGTGDAEGISERVSNIITRNSSQLGTSEVSIAIGLLEDLTGAAIEQPQVRDNYLQAIDNLLDIDPDVILSSQMETNSSARLLQSLTQFTEDVPLSASFDDNVNSTTNNDTNRLVFALRNFGLVLQDIAVDDFSGSNFSVDLGPVKDAIRLNGSIDEDSLLSVAVPNATASIQVPASVFDTSNASQMNYSTESSSQIPNLESRFRRLAFSVFLLNSLFIDSNTSCDKFAIGSVIISIHFNATNYGDIPSNESIRVSLQEYRETCDDDTIPESTMPMCARFDVTDDDVRWTSEDCTLISSEGGTTRCDCSQPGHFGLIFDIKPGSGLQPIVLQQISYIGAILSIICLMVMFCTILFSSDLRSAKKNFSGQLIMNICIALIGFYLVFLIAGHVTSVQPLCGLVAALIQYFLLAYFMWTAVAAVVLYLSIVYWFKKQGPAFVLKAAIIAWCLPLVIVAISAGVGHKDYISEYFCRSTGKPFYFGTLLPFGLIYLFNWIVFVLIIILRIRDHVEKSCGNRGQNSANDEKIKDAKKTVFLALGLSFLFGLGWGFGLAATSSDIDELSFVFQLLFSIFVGVQGILVLLLHGVRSKRVRNQWKVWSIKVCFCCKRFKLRPNSPTGVAEYGFQPNSPNRRNGNEMTLHGPRDTTNGVTIQNVHMEDSMSSSGSPPRVGRKHAHTVSTMRSHVALCRVDTQSTTVESGLSTSGGDSDCSGDHYLYNDPDKFLQTV